MKTLWAFLALLLSIGTALAADNAIVLDPGTTVTERSIDIGGGVQAPGVVPVGITGASAWGAAGTANANVLSVQGIAAMTPLLEDITKVGGATLGAATAWGTAPTGNVAGVNANIVACAAGICNANGQAVMANSAPVTLASNQSVGDPCMFQVKKSKAINLTASGSIAPLSGTTKIYICAIHIVTATAQNIALVEGTGAVCVTNPFGLAGGATAGTGWNFAANSGISIGNGSATVVSPDADTNAAGAEVCLLLSSTGQTSGTITYVQQ